MEVDGTGFVAMEVDGTGFGTRLRACREEAGLSQQELADKSGLSVRAISNMERGRTQWPYRGSLARLADALDLPEKGRAEFLAAVPRRKLARPLPGADEACARGAAGILVPADHSRPIPRQLPATVRHFTGRAAELAVLDQLLDPTSQEKPGTTVISAIAGSAGVGKTALAVHWAHMVADRFPDGQLYLDLNGWGPSGDPVQPADAVSRFLDALGLAAEPQVPRSAGARRDLYRSVTAGRRMLILLDNARDAAQVRPLLPGGSSCLVLVTSRSELAGLVALEDAHPVSLDVLAPAEGRDMLASRIGHGRVAAEAAAAGELVELCARLPLALAVTAARAALRPLMPLAALAADLRDTADRLDVLAAADGVSVAAVFSWSYSKLPRSARRMFRLLSVHPGPDNSVAAAASLAGSTRGHAREMLALLAGASLLTEHPTGRFGFHDLLREYAAARARAEDGEADRRAVIRRVLDHYLHSARAADQMGRAALPAMPGPLQPGVTLEPLDDYNHSMAWLAAEQHVLAALVDQAAQAGFDTHSWQLAMKLSGFFDRKGQSASSLAFQQVALAATQRLDDGTAQALLHLRIGNTCVRIGAYHDAEYELQQSLRLYGQSGDRIGQARAHLGLCTACDHLDRMRDALSHGAAALALSEAEGDRTFQAVALNNLGWCHTKLADYQQALTCCEHAVRIHHELGEKEGEAHAWDSLGYARKHLGQPAGAVADYERSLTLFRAIGDRLFEAVILDHLGDAHKAGGAPRLAAAAWRQSADIFDELRDSRGHSVRNKI